MQEIDRAGEEELTDQNRMAEERRTRLTVITGAVGYVFWLAPLAWAYRGFFGKGLEPLVHAASFGLVILITVFVIKIQTRHTFREAFRLLWRTLLRAIC